MNTIYKLKEKIDLNELAKLGFEIAPMSNGGYTLFKVVEQPLNSELPRFLLQNFYENPEWIEKVYKPNKKKIRRELGLKYDKERKIVENEHFKEILTQWRIEISSDDDWIAMKSADPFDTYYYYSTKILDKNFSEIISVLKEKDLLEEIEAK